MRWLISIFVVSVVAGLAQAQPYLTNKGLSPDPASTGKIQVTAPEVVVKAATFMGDPSSRRTGSANTAKSVSQEADEPDSWRMLAASVLFMLVIALRRQRSGRP